MTNRIWIAFLLLACPLFSIESSASQASIKFDFYKWAMRDNNYFGSEIPAKTTLDLQDGGDRVFGKMDWADSDGTVDISSKLSIDGLRDSKCNDKYHYYVSLEQTTTSHGNKEEIGYSLTSADFCENSPASITSLSKSNFNGKKNLAELHLIYPQVY